MYKNVPPPPLRRVEVIVREDNGVDHKHAFDTRSDKESTIILDALVWFEGKYGTNRATEAQVIITKNELKSEEPTSGIRNDPRAD